MGNFRKAIWLLALIIIGCGIFFLNSRPEKSDKFLPPELPQSHSNSVENKKISQKSTQAKKPPPPHQTRKEKQSPLSQTEVFLAEYGNPQSPPHLDLSYLNSVLHIFNTHLKGKTLLPTDSNQSISKALLGKNVLNLQFIPPDFKYLNQDKELVDRWGTPLNFHFIEIDNPEIRSAGEDKVFWTNDDLLLSN